MEKKAAILIVDDDLALSRSFEMVLTKKGFDCRVAHSVGRTMELMKKIKFNIVLLDVKLSGESGLDLIPVFKKKSPDIAIVIITGHASVETATKALNEGVAALINKPANMDEVLRCLEQIIEKQKLQFENRALHQQLERELSERMQAESALISHIDFLQKLIDTIPNPIYYKDIKGTYLGCNKAFGAYVGFSRNYIIGKNVYNIMPRTLADEYASADTALFKRPGTQVYEKPIRYADGSLHDVLFNKATYDDTDGNLAGLVGIMLDITERKKAENDRIRLETAIEQAAESVLITDADQTVRYVNPATERITGYTKDEFIGKTPRILKSGGHGPSFYQSMWKILESGKTWSGHFTNKRKDGSLYQEEASITPVKGKNGKITNYVAVKKDVTNEIQREKQLRQAQKMEAIGTLAGGIAHDFNNILAAIMGYAELTRDELAAGSRAHSYLEEVFKASHRARDLVTQILTISRQGEQEKRPIQAHLIVKEALKLLHSTLPATIKIKSKIPKCGSIDADPTQIHQICMNLCTNAYHAMADTGGVLSVSLSQVTFHRRTPVVGDTLDKGDYINIRVEDNGHGMDPMTLERIFDPYYTTKPKDKGTGLGLSVVHSIVQQYGGGISVTSQKEEGTVFNVYFPGIESMPEPVMDEPLVKGGEEKILVVDDEPAVARICELMLSSIGYGVASFTSGLDALEAFEHHSKAYDLVITDYTMPKMTGVEMAVQMHKVRPDIPIILCTGFSEQITPEKLTTGGISELALKPLKKSDLAVVVRKVLDANMPLEGKTGT